MGYDGVEFAGLYGHTAEEVREMCADLGLVPISAHVSYGALLEDPEIVFGKYATVGCRYVAIPYLNPEHRPEGGAFMKVIANIAEFGRIAQKFGMQLLYHNHDFEFVKLNDQYALDLLFDTVPAELLGTELDLCWVKVGGEDPSEYLLKYAGRAPAIHLQDFAYGSSEDSSEIAFRPVGGGVQDCVKILEAAKKAGVSWVIVEQDEPTVGMTSLECAEKSRAYLKSIGN